MSAKTLSIKDLTAAEARVEMCRIRDAVGSRADVTAGLSVSRWEDSKGELYASIYPQGLGRGDQAFTVNARNWRDLVDALTAKWAEFSEEHAKRLVRNMALEIIRITADQGECTDAALRAGQFSGEEVTRYGEQACADATEIAGLGPFSIVTLGGANSMAAA